MFFSCFYVLLTVCVVVLYQWHIIDLFSRLAASLFNKLTYLLYLLIYFLRKLRTLSNGSLPPGL